MLTPGIGPATVGLSGFALFVDSHAAAERVAARISARRGKFLFMGLLRG